MPATETAQTEIFELNRLLSATAGAVDLFTRMKAADRTMYNLGQGREQDEPPTEILAAFNVAYVAYVAKWLREMFSSLGIVRLKTIVERLEKGLEPHFRPYETATEYNAHHGGDAEVKSVAGAWMKRFFGLDSDATNTFVFQQLGRAVNEAAAHTFRHLHCKPDSAGKVRRPVILIPHACWPMLTETFADFEFVGYDVNEHDQADNILKVLRTLEDREVLVYLNFPHNPTGRMMSEAELAQHVSDVSAFNEQRAKHGKVGPVTLHFDTPYFQAAPQNEAGSGKPWLQLGYEALQRAGNVPYFVIASGSKAFGTANGGLAFASMHDSLVKPFAKQITASIGGAYSKMFFQGVKRAFAPEMDRPWRLHFHALRSKYKACRDFLADTMEKVANVTLAFGHACMTSYIELDAERFFGKEVTGPSGRVWQINDTNDIIEYGANERDVIMVQNNTTTGHFIRIAQATALEKGFRKGATNAALTLQDIDKAPRLAA